MAKFAKKLYMKNSAGTQQSASIYSTTGETDGTYMYVNVDGQQGYVSLGSTNSARATSGRVIKNGTTYAIQSIGSPAYSYGYYTASGTFTVPYDVVRLRVTCVGGGAGGWGSSQNIAGSTSPTTYYSGCAGGTTSFGSVSAGGGSQANITMSYGTWTSGEQSETSYTTHGYTISYGYHNGRYLNIDYYDKHVAGGASVPLTNYAGTVIGYAGNGGMADPGGGMEGFGLTGASGYRTINTITVTPGQTISFTVGGGGRGRCTNSFYTYEKHNTSSGCCAPGSSGAILVEWGKGIQ